MNPLRETCLLEIPADLGCGSEAVLEVLAWFRIQGYGAEVVSPWRLPISEAVTNAIRHGCRGRAGASVRISAGVRTDGAEVGVHDPGHYEPGPEAARLALFRGLLGLKRGPVGSGWRVFVGDFKPAGAPSSSQP